MRTSFVFLMGLMLGSVIAPGFAQGDKPHGVDYVNHVAISVANFDEAFAFYTKQMGWKEGFTVRNDQGQPALAYIQPSRNTFVELQPANANRPPGLNHYGLHIEDLKSYVARLKERGVKVTDVTARPDGSLVANATDPGGIRIEMFQFGAESAQAKAIASWK
jgi:predicted enzyme related to lactoylglutathione lyase